MKVIRSVQAMQDFSDQIRKRHQTIGFVPTMGSLHEGHLSLIRQARRRCDQVVLSIFVNPTQFGPKEDFSIYPRDLRGDTAKARGVGVDCLFIPSTRMIYPKGSQTFVQAEELTRYACGPFRPGHFRGVTTIVAKLFEIVHPHFSFFGQKDYQQFRVIQQMAKDLHMRVKVALCPTVREVDGLAMSSRNSFLSGKERKAACSLYRCLRLAQSLVREGASSAARVRRSMLKEFKNESLVRLEYLSICDPITLAEVKVFGKRTLVALAAWVGKTRLIDNILIGRR